MNRPRPNQGKGGGGGGGPKRKGPPAPRAGGREGAQGRLWLRRVNGMDFEMVHPREAEEVMPDYEEGMDLWREGDPEAALEALRFALEGCRYSLWVHCGLGRIALEEAKDARLAQGHFGYALELAERAIPPGFRGRLPRDRPANEPAYQAIEGLAAAMDALGADAKAADLRSTARRWENGPPGAAKSPAQTNPEGITASDSEARKSEAPSDD